MTTGLILRYVHQHGGPDAVQELLRRAQVPYQREELLDESRWVSYDARIRLFEAAVEVLDDPRCTFAMGATALRTGLNHSLVLVLRALGSPRQVYRQLPRAVPKFSTTSTMQVIASGATHATLRYRLHAGYVHSRLDCLYAQGLISIVPEIFGMPPAVLVHDECESDGAPACLYHLTWVRRSRLPRLPLRRRPSRHSLARDPELVALRGQLQALQSAAAELAGSDDLTAVLRRITDRAAAAVLAPSYLLAVHAPQGGPPLVHSSGIDPEQVSALAGRLLDGHDLGPGAVAVHVASSRRVHGVLAAIYAPGQRGPGDERPLLAAYAGHAAAALDLLLALEDSRRQQRRSAALLTLARQLKAATDDQTVAQVMVASLPQVVGCDTSAVLFWEGAAGQLRPIASQGLTQTEHTVLHAAVFRADQTPEVLDLLTLRAPQLIRADTASPGLRALLHTLNLSSVAVVPLLAGDELLGVATACWRPGQVPVDLPEVIERLQGVGEYGATALQNARLLSTVRHQALHDVLTGLPNRVLFSRAATQALQQTGPAGGVAVLFCDLDRFKGVNDRLGHAAGDELLRQVAARLRAVLRSGDVVGRLSGDEFALLLPGVDEPPVAETLGQRVIASFQDPFHLEGRELRVTTSVGVALHRGENGRAESLLRAADAGMYTAKQRGRNQLAWPPTVALPSPGPPPAGPSLEAELRSAVEHQQLRLHFQPLIHLDSAPDRIGTLTSDASGTVGGGAGGVASPDARVVGAEALLRWQHPRLGLLAPVAFLPLAEEAGLSVELDLWVLAAACQALAGWPNPPHARPLHISVNLAGCTLLDARLPAAVRAALSSTGLAPDRLYLEVVESRPLVDLSGVVERLGELRQLGVRIALDDFGTGYSTLSWLQRLPVDQLKIDRTFTAALPHDTSSLAVVRSILALGKELNIEVVAEGVETPEQRSALQAAGCTLLQGYLLGHPAPHAPRQPVAPQLAEAPPAAHAAGRPT